MLIRGVTRYSYRRRCDWNGYTYVPLLTPIALCCDPVNSIIALLVSDAEAGCIKHDGIEPKIMK